jgi:hypothetical protein
MPTPVNFKDVIHYTILAATTVKNIAETAKVPFLGSTATLCLSITKGIEVSCSSGHLAPYLTGKKTTRSNREKYVEIMEHIHEVLCIIVQLNSTSEIKGVLPIGLLYDISKFTESAQFKMALVSFNISPQST